MLFGHDFNNIVYKNVTATIYIRIVFFIFYRHLILIDPMQRPMIGPREHHYIAFDEYYNEPIGRSFDNCEIPFVTS